MTLKNKLLEKSKHKLILYMHDVCIYVIMNVYSILYIETRKTYAYSCTVYVVCTYI